MTRVLRAVGLLERFGPPGGPNRSRAEASGAGSDAAAGDVVPLSRRVGWLMAVRVTIVVVVAVGWRTGLAGGGVRASWDTVAGVLGLYVVVSGMLSMAALAALALLTRGRRVALSALTFGLTVDGVALVAVRELIWTSPTGLLLPAILLAAVCLLASFRTGARLAVWQSLLVAVEDSAHRAGLVAHSGPPPEVRADILLLWLLVIVVGSAAAVSERELRRRRYDAEALQHFAAGLHACHSPQDVIAETLRFVVEELDAGRAIACRRTGSRLVRIGRSAAVTAAASPGTWSPDGLLATVMEPGSVGRLLMLDPVRDPWLAEQLPNARRLVVVTLVDADAAADTGLWIVFEHTGARGSSLERRILAAAGQAGATAALALSRAILFRQQQAVALTDALTGLPNRRSFDELTARLDHGEGGQRTEYAIVLVDIDHFKKVNDTHGHQIGDEVLGAAAQALAAAAPPEAMVARYGGEEFVAVLPRAQLAGAVEIAETLRLAVSAIERPLRVTASFGVALAAGRSAADTVAAADAALYRAKESGRDRVVAEQEGPPAPTHPTTHPIPRQPGPASASQPSSGGPLAP